jgi:ribosomal protein S18 acetylase RimI-like enzyme
MGVDRRTSDLTDDQVVTRDARTEDEPFLREMLVHAARPPWDLLPIEQLLQDPVAARYIVGWGHSGDHAVIAETSGRRIGAAWYRRFSIEEPGYGFVSPDIPELAIALHPDWRGRGVGRRLLEALIDHARATAETGLSLSVSRKNPVALRLYESLGFRPFAGRQEHPTMLLDLTGRMSA